MEAETRRLNRWSWIFVAVGTMRALIVPLIAAIFASGGVLLWRPEWLLLVLVVPSAIFGLIRQRIYSYRFTDSALVVRDGLLTRNVREIPYERIHNVALVRNPLHRALGVASVRIETAAGGKPEAVLSVLSLEAAQEMRQRSLEEEAFEDRNAESERRPLVQTPDGELVRLGLISNRGFLVVAAVVGVLSQMDWSQQWVDDQDWLWFYESAQKNAPAWLQAAMDGASIAVTALIGAMVFVLALALLRLLSVAWYLVRYRGFTLRRQRDDLQAAYGLFTRVSSVIPVHRIQLVTVTVSLLHRWFGRASIEAETAGSSEEDSDFTQQLAASGVKLTRQWLAPIVRIERPAPLLHEIMPEVDLGAVEWRPIDARAVRRIVRRVAWITLFVAAASLVPLMLTPIGLYGANVLWLPVVAIPSSWFLARRWVRNAGWALTDHAIFYRSGWPGISTSFVRFGNLQSVSMNQSPFDRRYDMASLHVDTAGAGSMGHRVAIPFLDEQIASETLRRLYDECRATEFRW